MAFGVSPKRAYASARRKWALAVWTGVATPNRAAPQNFALPNSLVRLAPLHVPQGKVQAHAKLHLAVPDPHSGFPGALPKTERCRPLALPARLVAVGLDRP